jgi:hypothetical protein
MTGPLNGSRGLRANGAEMLIPTMSGKESAGTARVKAARPQLRSEVALRRVGHAGTLTSWWE